MMFHLMTFWARLDAKARENIMFAATIVALAYAVIIPMAAMFVYLIILYPMLLLVFPIAAIGWIIKVGIGKRCLMTFMLSMNRGTWLKTIESQLKQ